MKKITKEPKIKEFSKPCKSKGCIWKNSKNSHHCYYHGVLIDGKSA